MPYAPKAFLVRPRAPVLFQPLVHPEHPAQQCFRPVLQSEQCSVRQTQQRFSVEYLTRIPALSSWESFLYFAGMLGDGGLGSVGVSPHHNHHLGACGIHLPPMPSVSVCYEGGDLP